MVICLERGADLHTAQLMPLPLTVSCFSKVQIGFTFLVLAHLGSPEKRAVKWVCVEGEDGSHEWGWEGSGECGRVVIDESVVSECWRLVICEYVM